MKNTAVSLDWSNRPLCPEHGATLGYGQVGDINIYRCTLGFCKVDKFDRVEYVEKTHREFWAYSNGIFIEVEPHTSPSQAKSFLERLLEKSPKD
ncbi:MAG: hypothetical protein V1839_00705 [archaeon]